MATVTVQKKEPTPPEVESVTLVLSVDEAKRVTRYLGTNNARNDNPTYDIFYPLVDALEDAGVLL